MGHIGVFAGRRGGGSHSHYTPQPQSNKYAFNWRLTKRNEARTMFHTWERIKVNCYTDWQRMVVKWCATRTVLGKLNQAAQKFIFMLEKYYGFGGAACAPYGSAAGSSVHLNLREHIIHIPRYFNSFTHELTVPADGDTGRHETLFQGPLRKQHDLRVLTTISSLSSSNSYVSTIIWNQCSYFSINSLPHYEDVSSIKVWIRARERIRVLVLLLQGRIHRPYLLIWVRQ